VAAYERALVLQCTPFGQAAYHPCKFLLAIM
jgi:hypothetical protein